MLEIIHIPSALVLGCNTPHGIGVLSDWIEEQTGYPPDFHQSGWSTSSGENIDCYCSDNGDGHGNGAYYNYGSYSRDGSGRGCGYQYGFPSGNGYGFATGYGNQYGGSSIYALINRLHQS